MFYFRKIIDESHGQTRTTPIKHLSMTSDYCSDDSQVTKARITKTTINAAPRSSIHPNNFNDYLQSPPPVPAATTASTTDRIIYNNSPIQSFVTDTYHKNVIGFTSTPVLKTKSSSREYDNQYESNYSEDRITTSNNYLYGQNAELKQQENYKEISQNNLNAKKEFNRFRRSVSDENDPGVTILNSSNNLAYLEYKRAGEYWRNTPKTDYTYSKFSRYRRELAPGVVAMPNMSRRGLLDMKSPEEIRRRLKSSEKANGSLARIGQYIWPSNSAYALNNNQSAIRQNHNQNQNQNIFLWSRFATLIGTLLSKLKFPFTRSGSDVGRYTIYDNNQFVDTSSYKKSLYRSDRGTLLSN